MTPHLAVLLVWSAVLIAVGWRASRGARTASGFFVAGRRLPARLVFATVLAANIGAGSTVGAAALGYQHGLAAWWWVGAAGIGTLLLAVWLGPRMWRTANRHRLRTVGDFLELRYGATTRVVLTGLLLVATLFVLAAQLLAAGVLIGEVADIPLPLGILFSAGVMTAYFIAGGLASAAVVNLAQLVVLVVGLGLVAPWAFLEAGRVDGGAAWSAASAGLESGAGSPGRGPDGALDVLGSGALAFGYLALLVPAFLVSPGILQKLFGGRSERAVRRGLAWAGGALLLFALVPPLIGAAAAVLHPDLGTPDAALPAVLVETLPVWLGCLGVAALFSAEVSSADAVLFMLSTAFSRDIYQRWIRPEADDRAVLRAARGAAVLSGIVAVGIAVGAESVISSLTVFYTVLGVSLFVPVVAGLHRFRPGGGAVLAGAAAGVAVFLVVPETAFLPPPLLGIGASAAVIAVVSRLS